MAIVVFDPAAFIVSFPEFAGISSTVLAGSFDIATLYCNNTDAAIIGDIPTRTKLLWLLTAHVTKLYRGTNDGAGNVVPPSPTVGRLSNGVEGSVRVTFEMGGDSPSAAWFNQTQYGAAYWAATVRWRTARYVPLSPAFSNPQGPTPAIQPWPWPWGWGRF